MKYHQLKTRAKTEKKRVGRGIGSGKGKTAGRGTKGQNARSGGGVRPGFEGGQNPLMKRLPRVRGRRPAVDDTVIIHTDQLNRFKEGDKITKKQLHENGLIPGAKSKVKLLSRGPVEKALKLEIDSCSKPAKMAVEKAGGSIIGRQA